MEDDTAKEDNQPSASKKESQRIASAQDLYSERRKYEGRDDRASNSESFTSGSYSARSRIDVADVRPEIPKPPIGKREAKAPEKKKRGRRVGRVDKRRRSPMRRIATRRAPRRKPRKERELSMSTIFTKLSSQSGSRTPGCKFCGHRCCRRRYEYYMRRAYRKCKTKKVRKHKPKALPNPEELIRVSQASKRIQKGSRSLMLSPLFISTNSTPTEEAPIENSYCEITPEMIYESLRTLSMWKQSVLTSSLMYHIKRNYPVNHNQEELLQDLTEKLRVAAIVGMVTCVGEERWCLNCALQDRGFRQTHVTKFWQVYADTLTPIRRQKPERGSTLKRDRADHII